ncbi:caspase family protein [Candidatus Woesearchaeota archaeon]|nr:caspase family protein [Candidatus Woesearchaeota archaeon]
MPNLIQKAVLALLAIAGISGAPQNERVEPTNHDRPAYGQVEPNVCSQPPQAAEINPVSIDDIAERPDVFPDFEGFNNIYSIIINGDDYEERHLKNVRTAKSTLESLGVAPQNILVVDKAFESDKDFSSNKVFSNSSKGLETALKELRKTAKKGDLIFFYTTGHGGPDNGGCIRLPDKCYGVDDFVEQISFMKDIGIEGIFVFDHCYSGIFPHKIVDGGIVAKAMAPVVEGKESSCHKFVPYFWEAVNNRIDLNKDGKSTFLEAFDLALAHHEVKGKKLGGTYRETIRELTLDNYDSCIDGKPTIIDLTATWCGACKAMEPDINKLKIIYGDELNIVKITTDTNKDKEEIFKRLGIPEANTLPTLAFWSGGNISIETGSKNTAQLNQLVEKYFNIEKNEKALIENITNQFLMEKKLSLEQKYDDRFNLKDVIILTSNAVEPEKANKYSTIFGGREISVLVDLKKDPIKAEHTHKDIIKYAPHFEAEDLEPLIGAKIKPQKANKYNKRFNGWGIRCLVGAGVSPEKADTYRESFKGHDIAELVEAGISPEKAAEYNERFGGAAVAKFLEIGITPKEADTYDERFGLISLYDLTRAGVRPKQANAYNKRFSGGDIAELVEEGIPSKVAEKYSERFFGRDIANLVKAGVSPELADEYSKLAKKDNMRITGSAIANLVKANISPDLAKKYNEFWPSEIIRLVKTGISPELANTYTNKGKKFSGAGVIIDLIEAGIGADQADEYDIKRFNYLAIIKLVRAGISADQANAYDKRFNFADVMVSANSGLYPDQANEYDERFSVDDIIGFFETNISSDYVNSYNKRFNRLDVLEFTRWYVHPDQANKYKKRFNAVSIIDFAKAKISPKKANAYHKALPDYYILRCAKNNIPPKEANKLYRARGLEAVWKRCEPRQ